MEGIIGGGSRWVSHTSLVLRLVAHRRTQRLPPPVLIAIDLCPFPT
jgi:hypothetical protein